MSEIERMLGEGGLQVRNAQVNDPSMLEYAQEHDVDLGYGNCRLILVATETPVDEVAEGEEAVDGEIVGVEAIRWNRRDGGPTAEGYVTPDENDRVERVEEMITVRKKSLLNLIGIKAPGCSDADAV